MNCDCEYCSGDARIVPFDLVSFMIPEARKAGVTIKKTDLVFVIDGVKAVACVREIRRSLARLCGCWVGKEFRGMGVGKQLVLSRIAFIENHMSVRAIDTFAFRKKLFLSLGFEERNSYKIGTTLLRKVLR